MDKDIMLQADHVTKLYGRNKAAAIKMMKAGSDKNEVYKKTGVAVALWDTSFQVKRGEIFVIIGLSGSGKSTIIRCFNRLIQPTSGHLTVAGQQIDGMSKQELRDFRRSKVSMVFQNFGLFTHRNVLENVAYGPEIRGTQRQEREEKAMKFIRMVGLDGWENQPISSLSGGMKQRVGIARALCNDPEVLLMDEPFSALDPLVRRDMQFELLTIQRKLGKTILFITHDINEAFKLGDTVAIMRDGKIVQIDTPENMSMNPADDYVSQFIESADKTQILTLRHVMVTPGCLVKKTDDAAYALREMRRGGLSSAYVVDDQVRLLGILTLEKAMSAMQADRKIGELYEKDVPTAAADTTLTDIMPIAAQSRYPIAVVDDDGVLQGIVSKASVIGSMV